MPDPKDQTPKDAEDREGRTDAAGFDVTPPPGAQDIGSKNRGLSDDPMPEREGWREFDATAEWTGDDPYPEEDEGDRSGDDEDEGEGQEEDEDDEEPPQSVGGGDLMDRVSTALEDDETILIDDLSVELRGAVVVLRGIAGSPEDRTRAGDLASAVPGVERVDNQLGADPAEED